MILLSRRYLPVRIVIKLPRPSKLTKGGVGNKMDWVEGIPTWIILAGGLICCVAYILWGLFKICQNGWRRIKENKK